MKYCVLTLFYFGCLIDCIYSQDSRDMLEGKIFCVGNPESRYDSIKFFKNDFKLVFKNKKIEDGEWNLRKNPNESKGYLVFNPNLKNTEELKFEIKKNSFSEIVNVIIEDVSFYSCSNKSNVSFTAKDSLSPNIEKLDTFNLSEKVSKVEISENNTVKKLSQEPVFIKKTSEIVIENSNNGLALNDNKIVNSKDNDILNNKTELEKNIVADILYSGVIQIAAFLDMMNAEKFYAKAKILGYNVKINFKGEYYKIYVIPETTDNINLILQDIKGKVNKQAFITNIYK